MFKRGSVYFHPNYVYPNGNTQDKLLVVINKLHLNDQPVIIIPVTTDKKINIKKDVTQKVIIFELTQMKIILQKIHYYH